MNQVLLISSCFPLDNVTICSFCHAALVVVVHVKSFCLTFTVVSVISTPVFAVSPILANVVVKPVTVGIDLCSNKSDVFEVYTSTLPEILFLNKLKSTPTLYWVVFSQPSSWFAKTVFGIEPAVLEV